VTYEFQGVTLVGRLVTLDIAVESPAPSMLLEEGDEIVQQAAHGWG